MSGAAAIPLSGSGDGMRQKVLLPGDSEETPVRNNFVAPRYFAVMGTRLLRGRDFDARDTAVGKSVVVNETMAKRLAGNGEAVGRWIRVEGVDREVIGVVEDGKYRSLRDEPIPFMYLPSGAPGILAIVDRWRSDGGLRDRAADGDAGGPAVARGQLRDAEAEHEVRDVP